MFNGIEYVNDLSSTDKNGKQIYIYQYLIYTRSDGGRYENFRVKLPIPVARIPADITRAAAIIVACKENRRSVSKMLSEWFIQTDASLSEVADLGTQVSRYFPELQYEKYAKCTRKRIEMLMAKR